jgi:hypothetical protein
MERDKDGTSLKKPISYLSVLEQSDPLRDFHIDYPLPYGRKLSPEELEEQKRRYRHFLLSQIIRT